MSANPSCPPWASRARVFESLLVILVLFALAVGPAAGQEDAEKRTVTKRPVVVVSGDQPHVFQTWTSIGARSFLGVRTLEMTADLRRHFGVPEDAGVLVAKVIEDSPAALAGLEAGDVLTALDSETIESPAGLARAIGSRESGDSVLLEVWRDERVETIEATLGERQGPTIDIRQFGEVGPGKVEAFAWSNEGLDEAIEIETRTFTEAIERLQEKMNSPEWHSRIEGFRKHQTDLMKRIEELEGRLRELETEIDALPERE